MAYFECRTLLDDSDSDEEDNEDDLDEDPVLELRSVPHNGGVNRVHHASEKVGL